MRVLSLTVLAVGVCANTFQLRAASIENFSRLPLSFEPLETGRFVARAGTMALFVSATGAALGSQGMRLRGANPAARPVAEGLLPGKSHYLIGNDRHQWRTNVPNYARVRFRGVYPGIDLVYYGNRRELEFDFIVAPGADPSRIQLAMSGPDVRLREPRIYQGSREIQGHAVRKGNRVAFELAAYDHSRELVIDPVLSIATMLGGGSDDTGAGIAVDPSGAIYVTGTTSSGNFPIANALQPRVNIANSHVFVTKLNPAGTALVYSTYLGGAGTDSGSAIAVDAAGRAHITGQTSSRDFPVVGSSPLSPSGDAFAAKLSSDGSALIYSTFMDGVFLISTSIAVDGEGNAYITGSLFTSSVLFNFPVVNPLQPKLAGGTDGFVVKLSADGTPIYSTYLGGSGDDKPSAIAVDRSGNAYITGSTYSADYPVRNAMQGSLAGGSDAFVTKLNADGSALVYSTYAGGGGKDSAAAIVVDATGAAYIAGATSSGNFPAPTGQVQPALASAFAYKSTDGAANWSRSDTGLGSTPEILVVDPVNTSNVYAVAGGELFKSRDGGVSWRSTGARKITALAINPADSSIVFAGTGCAPGYLCAGEILRSMDGGVSFSPVVSYGSISSVSVLAFDPKNPSIVLAGSRGGEEVDGLLKSSDGGDTWTWTEIRGPGSAVTAIAFNLSSPSTVYVSTGHNSGGGFGNHPTRLRKSVDGGDTFIDIPSPGPLDALLVDPKNSTLYAFIYGFRIFRSTDGGQTFSTKGFNLPFRINALAIDPSNFAILYVGSLNGGAFKSTDGGDSWQPVSRGFTNLTVASLAIDPKKPDTVYAGIAAADHPDAFVAKLNPEGGLVYATYLGGRGAESVSGVAVDALGNAYVAGTTSSPDFPVRNPFRQLSGLPDGYLAKLNPTGSALVWSSFLGGATPLGMVAGAAGGIYLTGSSFVSEFPLPNALQPFITGTIIRSTDGGSHWAGGFPGGANYSTVDGLAIDPKTPSRVFARQSSSLFLSRDSGASWNQLSTIPMRAPSTPVIDPQNPSTMYLADAQGGAGQGILKSTDGGVNWAPLRSAPSPVSGFAIDPKTPSTLYAASLAGVFKSTDSASTWNLLSPNLPNLQAVAIDPLNPSMLYASGTDSPGGVFRSADAGVTWRPASNGLPAGAGVRILLADPTVPGLVYAAGGAGVYRSADGGGSWSASSGLPSGASVSALSLVIDSGNRPTLYAAPVSGGLYKSTDRGATWTLTPLTAPLVTAIVVDPTNPARIYVGAVLNPRDAFVAKVVE